MNDLHTGTKEFTADELSLILGGELVGNGSLKVSNIAKIEEAGRSDLSFIANPKYLKYLHKTEASILIVSKDVDIVANGKCAFIKVDDPYSAFTTILNSFEVSESQKKGIESTAVVSSSCLIANSAYIGHCSILEENVAIGENTIVLAQAYIGKDVEIGKNCKIHPGARIYHGTVIGDNCIVHSGVVIGSDGFGFAPQKDGSLKKIAQLGNVEIGHDVEIGSNSTIDRATMGATRIANGVKIDNLVQIGHNVEIGQNTVIAGQTGIAGSSKIGKNCIIGGQVGIIGHVSIADGTQLGAKSGVSKNIKHEFKKWDGHPLMQLNESLKAKALYRRLPELEKRIYLLEKLIEELKVTS